MTEMTGHPVQRDGLEITEVEDGVVVFDPASRKVHHLNVTALAVFELCTGEIDAASIASIIGRGFGLTSPPIDAVGEALTTLADQGLITT